MVIFWPLLMQINFGGAGIGIPSLNALRIIVICLLAVILLRRVFIAQKLSIDVFLCFFAYFTLYLFFSSIISPASFFSSLQRIVDIFVVPASFYFVLINTLGELNKRVLCFSVLFAGLIIGGIGITEAALGYNIYGPEDRGLTSAGLYRTKGPFNDGITYGAIMLFYIPFAWYCKEKNLLPKLLCLFCVIYYSLASAVQMSKACWLVLAVMFALLFFRFKKQFVVYLVILFFSLLFIFYFFGEDIENSIIYQDRIADTSTVSDRQNVYEGLLKQYKDNPILGVGYQGLSSRIHPHNSYLEVLIELGLFGFFSWLLMIFSPFWVVLKRSVRMFPDKCTLRTMLCYSILIIFVPMTVSAFNSTIFMFQYLLIMGIHQHVFTDTSLPNAVFGWIHLTI